MRRRPAPLSLGARPALRGTDSAPRIDRSPARKLSRLALALLALALLAGAPPRAQAGAAPPALEPPATGGLPAVERTLARLTTHQRLLVVAAHPDDEDTQLLTLVARGMGGEAAYLSLSRGEGGQNLIGSELGVDLGLLRSRELLAARAIDGGRQFFTRAYDFGFTRSLEETLALWPRDVLLEDVVRVVRRFKPQVVVSVFRGTPHPNHGQHQAAGVVAHEGYRLAGDPAALPQLAAEGLAPWRPQALYRSTFFDREATTLSVPTGVVDPLTGRSIAQLAMASRGMHRSQDMGRLLVLGPRETRVGWVDGGAGPPAGAPGTTVAAAGGLFAGIDTHLAAIAAPLADEALRRRVAEHLTAAETLATRARAELNPARLAAVVPPLAEILAHLRTAQAALASDGDQAARHAAELVAEKVGIAESGLAAAAGVAVEAAVARETVTAGETLTVQASLWNSGAAPLAQTGVAVVAAPDWSLPPVAGTALPPPPPPGTPPAAAPPAGEKPAPGSAAPRPVAAGELVAWEVAVPIPADASPTAPYFLRRPLAGALYDWSDAPPTVRGEPFEPPPLTARFALEIAGVPVTLEREVVYRVGDQARGEVRRPLRVVPAIEVALARDLLVWPLAQKAPRRLEVTVASRAPAPLSGRLEAVWRPAGDGAGAAWPAPPAVPFTLAAGERRDLELAISPPAGLRSGRAVLEVAAVLADGRRFAAALPLVEHEHVRPTPRPTPATLAVTAADLTLPRLARVGYVRGASDRVPELLREVGVPLELLDERALLHGDLGRYDAIVAGSRAYESEPALARANGRLLDYVRQGGLMIVQYQQYAFVEGGFAPLPLEIARPHDRVTDETAPVVPLVPDHPVFTAPNRLEAADWEGWVQERGLYFAHTWDPGYTPLLSTADPGGPELRGGLLVARVGEGTYVYTGLALFRQIPAGVPGAYRLMANLLALAEHDERRAAGSP
jgi:LmbE family N-acetylglucosaminyl deacetylase